MNIRERVSLGRSVRAVPFADELGVPVSTVYAWIKAGKLQVIRFEGTILIPAAAARPLLGMAEPAEAVAA